MTRARPFRRVLVANRGEIAVRVIRGVRAAGLESVAVYSEADRGARHAALADDAVEIGPAPATESYLSIPRLLAAAKEKGCDAVHPGYGFLSENADFARAVESAGLVWIGPPPEAMEAMGSKISSRERMKAAGVPVVPGALIAGGDEEKKKISLKGEEGSGSESASRVAPRQPAASGTFREVLSLGLPIVVKASAGGGGKGMRIVRDPSELSEAISSCRREAAAAFGDGTVYVEKYLEKPRHVEVQVFGDSHGNVVAIGERECSLQRRHQKVVEECPSPAVTPELRARLAKAAVDAARAVGYENAGTVEFLLSPTGEFYFLEMNTRLQVEHPVTEEAFGVDLVLLQLAVAAGETLPPLPAATARHAMEARVYAEDPEGGFLPQTGRVLLYREPSGPGVRVESGLAEGQDVGVHYDPLLAKIVASGATRDEARRRLSAALGETVILGVVTNVAWLRRLLGTREVAAGAIHTGLLETLAVPAPPPPPEEAFAAAAAALSGMSAPGGASAPAFPD
ncbi:MAG TPA: biotin carboxylase N-terminal domain-containing protein, partial [Thermoanaerobaculia bacterium]|nr:biotin carboxylase N-terminal domain-containing protein [Thermoanaerobaculia bacterium]